MTAAHSAETEGASFCGRTSSPCIVACGNGKIWDVSSSAAVSEVFSGCLYNNWQYVQFKDRIIACNGYDTPLTYRQNDDGEWEWEEAAFTGDGLTAEKLINVCVSKQRLFFVEVFLRKQRLFQVR